MNRDHFLEQIQDKKKIWDMLVIGGGASGAGVVLEAASRGYSALLLEQSDFAKGTSSRSTKLVHGGVRYLQQGNISLVLEALKERGIMRQNAPHLVHDLAFIVPSYDWWEGPFYGIGLKVYDLLSGKQGFGNSKMLTREETIQHLPNIETHGLNGGVLYYDGQFDDARLVINILQTAAEQGAAILNYMRVISLQKKDNIISGVLALDQEKGKEYSINAKVVINATGPWSDQIRGMENPQSEKIITPSRGTHIVLDRSFLPGTDAIMVPHTDDGRILFAIPWQDRVVVGTTDVPMNDLPLEPTPTEDETDFLLEHTARYLKKDPSKEDVRSVFSGIRPLVTPPEQADTAAISREHLVYISAGGLVTLAGGKWTTYRKMAEDTVDQALLVAGLDDQPSVTKTLNIHGYHQHAQQFESLADYGADALEIKRLMDSDTNLAKSICHEPTIYAAEVIWTVRHEMARTVEDFLARRTRLLLLDAKKSMQIVPTVARLMASEMNKSESWLDSQVSDYNDLARNYLLH